MRAIDLARKRDVWEEEALEQALHDYGIFQAGQDGCVKVVLTP
jgi:hypothetical protein